MHRVASSNSISASARPPRKEARLSYVLNDADDKKHCAGVNCVVVLKSSASDGHDYVFTGSRDGTLKRWALTDEEASCSTTFESHVDWVNDAVLAADVLVSCSSDTTIKTWNSLSDGACTGTLRQHSDYVMCLAANRKRSNIVASAGLGGEVFIWDLNAAHSPIASPIDTDEEKMSSLWRSKDSNDILIHNTQPQIPSLWGSKASNDILIRNTQPQMPSLWGSKASNDILIRSTQPHGHNPIPVKGHKKSSIYSLAMSDNGNVLVSGGTEKVIRVWDTRTGCKNMKLKGHSDNIRALLLDSTGRFCLSGSSDKMICLWDLGQQRCVHSYAVHKDSVFTLASTPEFTHVYSGGRDQSLYLTDLSTRESILLYKKEDPILRMALCYDSIWVATTDSTVDRLPAEGRKMFKNGASFLAGSLSFTRSRASSEGSAPVPVYKSASLTIPGKPRILQYEILNSRRHILTKDTSGSVKLWEITNGLVIKDYGKVSFEEKKKELFEKFQASIPAWFTADNRLGCLSIHLDSPQCFSAEMYPVDLNSEVPQDNAKINLAHETLHGLLAHWMAKRTKRMESRASSSNTDIEQESNTLPVHPSFEFSTNPPPSIVTQGSQGGSWRRRNTDLDGTEDEEDLPWWCIDCVLNGKQSQREVTQ